MAKRFRDESDASQVLVETGAKRLKGELPENEGAWEGLAAGKLAVVPLPGPYPNLAAPLRPANSAADSPDQPPPQQQWEQHSPPLHQQQQEQQPSPQQSPSQPQHLQQQQQHTQADEAAFAAAAGVDWNDARQVNAFLGWLHHERLRRQGQQPAQQHQHPQHQPGAA